MSIWINKLVDFPHYLTHITVKCKNLKTAFFERHRLCNFIAKIGPDQERMFTMSVKKTTRNSASFDFFLIFFREEKSIGFKSPRVWTHVQESLELFPHFGSLLRLRKRGREKERNEKREKKRESENLKRRFWVPRNVSGGEERKTRCRFLWERAYFSTSFSLSLFSLPCL